MNKDSATTTKIVPVEESFYDRLSTLLLPCFYRRPYTRMISVRPVDGNKS